MDTYELRKKIAAPYLNGKGLELGAGPHPQSIPEAAECLYFDIRNENELNEYFGSEFQDQSSRTQIFPIELISTKFPQGADFFIAHHVLEHCSNPIKTLIKWNRYLKQNGCVILSVPHYQACFDYSRLVPPINHLILDYLMDFGDNDFESREHINSFLLAQVNKSMFSKMTRDDIVEQQGLCLNADKNDCHWHAFDLELAMKVVNVAARLGQTKIDLKVVAAPFHTSIKTPIDILIIYRIIEFFHDSDENNKIAQVSNSFKNIISYLSEKTYSHCLF